ncbi:hypothetical protein HYU93_04100 [Candidatus Daviesbacteria bacterium]|nr:hypothetical protein [Candidatus Daviesbacteria bacterium]
MPENERPITDGEGLYKAMEDTIRSLHRPPLILRRSGQQPRPQREEPLVLRLPEAPVEPRRLNLTRHPQQPQRPERKALQDDVALQEIFNQALEEYLDKDAKKS